MTLDVDGKYGDTVFVTKSGARSADAQCQRFVQLSPGHELQRLGHLHLQSHGWLTATSGGATVTIHTRTCNDRHGLNDA